MRGARIYSNPVAALPQPSGCDHERRIPPHPAMDTHQDLGFAGNTGPRSRNWPRRRGSVSRRSAATWKPSRRQAFRLREVVGDFGREEMAPGIAQAARRTQLHLGRGGGALPWPPPAGAADGHDLLAGCPRARSGRSKPVWNPCRGTTSTSSPRCSARRWSARTTTRRRPT